MAQATSAELGSHSASAYRPGFNVAASIAQRTDILRFAEIQWRCREAANDLLQESAEVALRKSSSLAGLSTFETRVVSILTSRIADRFRQADRPVKFSSFLHEGDELDKRLDEPINERGGRRRGTPPIAWSSPEKAVQSRQCLGAIKVGLTVLLGKAGRVFMTREFLGLGADEICSQPGVATTNCHVLLHRARIAPRKCSGACWRRLGASLC